MKLYEVTFFMTYYVCADDEDEAVENAIDLFIEDQPGVEPYWFNYEVVERPDPEGECSEVE